MAKKIWWSTWPGSLLMGLVALVLAFAGFATGLAYLIIPPIDSAGIDFEIVAPPAWLAVVYLAQALAAVVIPGLTFFWARKRWAGYVLLGLGLSMLLGIVGLVQLGVL